MTSQGCFIISLDFEFQWGVRDKRSIEYYGDSILGARKSIPIILKYFDEYNIHATWAIVGFLFADQKEQINNTKPIILPSYENEILLPYTYLENNVGATEESDPYHYAKSIIDKITKINHQEIATHTYSHYYCLEKGQTLDQFRADLSSAIQISSPTQRPKSIVFPRNQYSNEYLSVAQEMGITCYRGNPDSFIYRTRSEHENNTFIKALKLFDSIINIDGQHSYKLNAVKNKILNIPASRFLRPYITKFPLFNHLHLKRIKNEMTYAAKNNELYHLWWHPHNFGRNSEKNHENLEAILLHYQKLRDDYGFQSLNMSDISKINSY